MCMCVCFVHVLRGRDVWHTWHAKSDGTNESEPTADAEHAAGPLHAGYDADTGR